MKEALGKITKRGHIFTITIPKALLEDSSCKINIDEPVRIIVGGNILKIVSVKEKAKN